MSEPIYVSRSRVTKVEGLHRQGHLEAGGAVDFGVHGAIKSLYKLDGAPDLPLPVDYTVAATGG
jgi:hypothetical protein